MLLLLAYIQGYVVSKMTIPMNLSSSVEEVKVFRNHGSLRPDFLKKVLCGFNNNKNFLVIVVSDLPKIFDNIKEAMPTGDVILHYAWNKKDADEREVCDWISDKSNKKYLITDNLTVAGFEFETVLIVADVQSKNDISNLYQRATAKLILCFYGADQLTLSVPQSKFF